MGTINRGTPKARAVRTFWAAVSGYAATWAIIIISPDWKAGLVTIGLNAVSAVAAAFAAYALAKAEIIASTAWGKALASFLQVFGTGLLGWTLGSFAIEDVETSLHALIVIAVAGVVAALKSYTSGWSEGDPAI